MYLCLWSGVRARYRLGDLGRRSRERARDLDLRLLLRLLGLWLLLKLLVPVRDGGLPFLGSGARGLAAFFALCSDLAAVLCALVSGSFWVSLACICFPRVLVDLTPPILGAGFRGGGARDAPVSIRADETRLFPTGSREFSGANLAKAAWTWLDTWAIDGRCEGIA